KVLLSLENEEKCKNLLEEVRGRVERNGVIESIKDGTPVFVHKTFAEYLVAEFLWDTLNAKANEEIFKIFLNKILFNSENRIIMKFLNRFLEKSPISEILGKHVNKTLEQINQNINNETCTILNTLAKDGNEYIFKYIFAGINDERAKGLIRRE